MSQIDDDLEFREERPRRPSARGSSGGVWALVAVLGLLVVGGGALVCCGGLMYFGFNLMTVEIETQLRDNPRLREHVGQIEDFRMNVMRSMAESDDDVYVYDVRGSKASGEVTVRHVTDEDGAEVILEAELRLSDGQTFDLVGEDDTP